MIVDLHAHFPMHLLADHQQRSHERARVWWRQRWQGRVVDVISRFANYQGPGGEPSVTEALMARGGVGVALSMLYQPFDEMDLTQPYAAPPRASYFTDLLDQRQTVEDYVAGHADKIAIAHSPDELDALMDGRRPVLIHAVEGGFQVAAGASEVRANVRKLADAGIAYITLAHLFFRQVATSAPALPFLPDWVYNSVFDQPSGEGLTALGRELVEAMIDEGILVDVTHMKSQAIHDVLALLDELDPAQTVPIIATHMACRFGGLEYCLDNPTIVAIAKRGGVCGLILCEHYITSGLGRVPNSAEGSMKALTRHIDRIHDLTGSYAYIAIGSDLDGYIKPALPGLQDMSQMTALQAGLTDRYGADTAEMICSANALRVLRQHWRRPRVPLRFPEFGSNS